MDLKRPKATTRRIYLNVAISAAVAVYFIWDWTQTDLTYSLVVGILFTCWSGFILMNAVNRRTSARLTDTALEIHHIFKSEIVPFAAVTAYTIHPESKINMIRYEKNGKSAFAPMATSRMGADNLETIKAALNTARPDLENLSRDDFRAALNG